MYRSFKYIRIIKINFDCKKFVDRLNWFFLFLKNFRLESILNTAYNLIVIFAPCIHVIIKLIKIMKDYLKLILRLMRQTYMELKII